MGDAGGGAGGAGPAAGGAGPAAGGAGPAAGTARTGRTGRPGRTVLFAPDSFKGSLTSVEVATALAAGWQRARPEDDVRLAPLADGGQGTLDAIAAAGGWTWREAKAHDPNMRPVRARWLHDPDGARAVVELAEASGLWRVAETEREPLAATTFGTGEVLRAALDAGARRIVLGIGGSATSDGAAGLLQALGARLLEVDRGAMLDGVPPALLPDIVEVDLSGLDPRLRDVELRIASDVTNPLLGPTGAAAVYGPQKGADPARVAALEAALAAWADVLEAAAAGRRVAGAAERADPAVPPSTPIVASTPTLPASETPAAKPTAPSTPSVASTRDLPGAGAAGGTGFGLLCLAHRFASLALVPGIALVMDATGFDRALAEADLVVTGEGRIDGQTAFGKTAWGVATRAHAAGVPCIAVGGGVESEGRAALEGLGVDVAPVWETPVPIDVAMAAGAAPLEACGERLARTIGAF